jgi:hypothetical protein
MVVFEARRVASRSRANIGCIQLTQHADPRHTLGRHFQGVSLGAIDPGLKPWAMIYNPPGRVNSEQWLPPGIPRSPVRSPIRLIEESGILIDLGSLQLTIRDRFLET